MKCELQDRLFWLAKEEEIKAGATTDIYFHYALQALKRRGLNPRVRMEVYARSLPDGGEWGVVSGIYEVAKLLEGLPVNVLAMEEGEIFLSPRGSALYEPIMRIEGSYTDLAVFENPILGFLCMSSGISTKAARLRLAAGDRLIFSFGSRRVHPALAPLVERAAYLGGVDAVSNILGAKLMGKRAVGTMPHSLILCFGDPQEAWRAFDEAVDEGVPRIALVDTLQDEKTEALLALATLGDRLYGVRLDTPSSRRGDMKKIAEEVRWELRLRGGERVKVFVSGGMDEERIKSLAPLVDGFGVGTSLSAAPVIDFNAKVVEVEVDGKWVYRAKRGDLAGAKMVYRKEESLQDLLSIEGKPPKGHTALLTPLIIEGRIVRPFRPIDELRGEVLRKLKILKERGYGLSLHHPS